MPILAHTIPQHYGGGGWEFGNSLGFYFRGDVTSTGLARIVGSPILRVELLNPWYTAEANLSAFTDPPFTVSDEPNVFTYGGIIQSDINSPAEIVSAYDRKFSAMAWSSALQKYVLFGGVDSVRALNDTWLNDGGCANDWNIVYPQQNPPARWGHCMVEAMEGVLIFGGFDANNKPLNDTWYFNGENWLQVFPVDGEVPRPRGGAAMCNISAFITLFGGTDGKRYFNDTWVLSVAQTNATWVNIVPQGEFGGALAPAPRAFMYYNNSGSSMRIFGGRTGLLPTGEDTDGDWIDDGLEYELGGPDEGRDPRANALITSSAALNTNAVEKLPYTYLQFGPPTEPLGAQWTWLADFESPSTNMTQFAQFVPPNYVTFLNLPFENLPFRQFVGGYSASYPDEINKWYHKHAIGDPLDPRDVWELGIPRGTPGNNLAPSYAYSGRWCWGTSLGGSYPNNAIMELYTPLFSLSRPASSPPSTDPSNLNEYFLVFHEWLDLADPNDFVRIEAVRPKTMADVVTRVSGVGKPPITILPNRNNSANTTGEWRRVIVPLEPIANETNLYLRFVLQTSSSGVAGGWYIDDFAIIQGGLIYGTNATAGMKMYLLGINGTNPVKVTTTGTDGAFGFNLLPSGNYKVVAGNGGAEGVFVGGAGWTQWVVGFEVTPIIVDIRINSPALLTWNAVPGLTYEVQVATPESIITANPWTKLAEVTASSSVASYVDLMSETTRSRFYRIVLKY